MANTTWNPSDLLNVTLSGGNLVATPTGQGLVRSVDSLASGKFYFEIAMAGANAGGCVLGMATAAGNLSTLVLTGVASAILNGQGTVNVNGTNLGGGLLGPSVSGTPFCIAVDLGAKLIWFRNGASGNWNGSGTANPATGVGGFSIASLVNPGLGLFACCGATGVNVAMTANFGGSAFTGAVPSGFTSGFTSGLGPPTSTLVTQAAVEHFIAPNPVAQVTQVSVEHFIAPSPSAQVTQVALEEWAAPNPLAQVTQVALEEWASVALYTTVPAPGAGEVDAAATVTGAGATLTTAAGAGEADAAATVTGAGAIAITGRGEVDAGATVTGAGATIHAVTGTGEVDAGADVEGAGFVGAIGAGEADAFADVRGMGAVIAPPNALPFLPGLGWSVHRRPTFDTIVATHPSGSEVRLALWQNCLWEFELSYDALASNDAYPGVWTNTLQTLMGFYLARGGQRGTFLFIDPDFNTMAGQGIGAGDGTTVVFPFVRAFGGQVEPVGWVTAVSAIYLDGAPVTSGWAIRGNVISFDAAPASGVVISADFSYAFVCRFLEDSIDFEEFMDNLWQLKSLKFRQVRL
jgi:uncharacterized protein (TIGR02217 family)